MSERVASITQWTLKERLGDLLELDDRPRLSLPRANVGS